MFKLDLTNVFAPQVHMIDSANLNHDSEIPFLNTETGNFEVFRVAKFDEKSIAVRNDEYERFVMKSLADISFDETHIVVLYKIVVNEVLYLVAIHQPD